MRITRQRWLRCVSISPANNRVSHYKGDTLIKVSWKNFQYPNLFISTHWKQYISVVLIQYIKSIIYEYLQGKISRLKELGLRHSCPWFVIIQCLLQNICEGSQADCRVHLQCRQRWAPKWFQTKIFQIQFALRLSTS